MERVLAGSFDFEGRVSTNGSGEPKDYSIDPVEQYLSEIGKIPLLTVEEEKLMGERILLGRLAAISLAVVSQRADLPATQVNFMRGELDKKGPRRLLACLDTEDFPKLEDLNRQVSGAKLRSPHKLASFKDRLLDYACTLNEQLDCAVGISGRKRFKEIKNVIENQLALVRDGTEAFEQMVNANLRLVIGPAKKLAGNGMPILDLIQEGNRGLIRAVEKFEITRGFKFSTYAMWWIRQGVGRGFANRARHIRLPIHVVEKIPDVLNVKYQLVDINGKEPTYSQIVTRAKEMGLKVSEEEVQAILFGLELVSLDTPVGEEEESTVVDFIIAKDVDVEKQAIAEERKEGVKQIMERELTPRERRVLELRYGILDGTERTLDTVGNAFGVSRERARQIEAQAFKKLKKCGELRSYKEWDPKAIPVKIGQVLNLTADVRRRRRRRRKV